MTETEMNIIAGTFSGTTLQYDFNQSFVFCIYETKVIGIFALQSDFFYFRYSIWMHLCTKGNIHLGASEAVSVYFCYEVNAVWIDNPEFDIVCAESGLLTVTNR